MGIKVKPNKVKPDKVATDLAATESPWRLTDIKSITSIINGGEAQIFVI